MICNFYKSSMLINFLPIFCINKIYIKCFLLAFKSYFQCICIFVFSAMLGNPPVPPFSRDIHDEATEVENYEVSVGTTQVCTSSLEHLQMANTFSPSLKTSEAVVH